MIEERFEVEGTPDLDVSVPAGSLTIDPALPDRSWCRSTPTGPSWHVGRAATTSGSITSAGRWPAAPPRPGCASSPRAGTTLNARTATDIRISVPLRRANVVAAAGDVEVAAAHLAIKTASGDVRIGAVDGDLEVRSASGDVDVGRVGANVGDFGFGRRDHRVGGGSDVGHDRLGDVRVRRYEGEDLRLRRCRGRCVGLPGPHRPAPARTLSGS